MAADEVLLNRVRAALGGVPGVAEKKMFGGVAFMVRGKMCVTVGRKGIMCRVDPETHEQAVERPGARAMIMRGRECRGWIRVDAEALLSKRDLDSWIKRALEFNSQAKSWS